MTPEMLTNSLSSQMFSSQMMSMAFLKDNITIYQIVMGILFMQFMNFLPHIKAYILKYIERKFNKTKKNFIEKMENNNCQKKEIKSSIKFNKTTNNNIILESINYYITNINNSKKLTFIDDFYVTNNKEFLLTKNIYCIVNTEISNNKESSEIDYEITIYSYDYELEKLKSFIDELMVKYNYEQKNKLGNRKFYFDEFHLSLPKNQDGSIKFECAPNNLVFNMTEFNTNKSLNNVFGKHLKVVKDRINLFINNPEWYEKKGIPYTLGILLHGPPGTGKTSLIKAIAKDTKRHIFNIKLQKDTTQTQLKNLFFEENISVNKNKKQEIYSIPLDERIYVIEDIDCIGDIVLQRKNIKQESNQKNKNNNNDNDKNNDNFGINPSDLINNNKVNNIIGYDSNNDNFSNFENNFTVSDIDNNEEIKELKTDKIKEETHPEMLNLSFLLNLMDGILETPGRILIMTTNYPEKLDKAFIRPGRIDINLEVGYCDLSMINEMYCNFYDIDSSKYILNNIDYKNKITPAEMHKFLLDNYNNKEKCLEDIKNYIV